MKVEELIEELEQMPKEAEVRIAEESQIWDYLVVNVKEEDGKILIEYREADDE